MQLHRVLSVDLAHNLILNLTIDTKDSVVIRGCEHMAHERRARALWHRARTGRWRRRIRR
jgi:hypothetical protein